MNSDFVFRKILIVDDNPNNLYVIHEVIRLQFPETDIVEACSGIEALTIVNNEPIDIIMMDVKMPDMDGFETAALIRGRIKTSQIPIIFLTAYNHDSPLLSEKLKLGKLRYLTKPIDELKLLNLLHQYSRLIRLKQSKANLR